MTNLTNVCAALFTTTLFVASCGNATSGDSAPGPSPIALAPGEFDGSFAITDHGQFDEPWAAAFVPGTPVLFITEQKGTIQAVDTRTGRKFPIGGTPEVDYGGQGGLGDIAFLASEASATLGTRTIYLSWAEAGRGDTRGAVVGRGQLVCQQADACNVENLQVIWRQAPKVSGRGHYSHRIAISPDERYLFVASGDRQKMEPAQDLNNTLGTIVRLNLDGSPASGNPFTDRGAPTNQIWSYGHRNTLGLHFDAAGRLWNMEHGPAGGDELNLITAGENYGWPRVSGGDHYDGESIPDNSPDDAYADPVINWTPVIAPGDFIFYEGDLFPRWQGDAIFAGLKTKALIRADMNGTSAREVARYDMGERIREIVNGPDGAIWILEDGDNARLRRLAPG